MRVPIPRSALIGGRDNLTYVNNNPTPRVQIKPDSNQQKKTNKKSQTSVGENVRLVSGADK